LDRTKGIHALIPKVDFTNLVDITLKAGNTSFEVKVSSGTFYVPLRGTLESLGATVVWDNSTTSATVTLAGKTAVVKSNPIPTW
jgi:Copper amine oxidase N-terminal domain.